MTRRVGAPKSRRLAETLEREIRAGRFAHGDQLASEQSLMRQFAVSRNTVRRGLEQLARKGLITTRTGIGSFVTYDGQAIDDGLGWSRALAAVGASEIETRRLDLRRGPCPASAAFLGARDAEFLCLDRLRLIADEGIGISLERSRLPWRPAFAAVLEEGLVEDSLSATLAALGLVVAQGEEWAQVLPALSKADAARMARPAGRPMLRLRRVTREASGAVIEYVESILDPAHFGLHLAF